MTIIHPNILAKMSAKDRKQFGKAGRLQSECDAEYIHREEREFQKQINGFLNLEGITTVWARTDKRTTTKKGVADFILCYKGKFIAWEAKTGTKQKPEQILFQLSVEKNGGQYRIVKCLKDCQEHLKEIDNATT